MGPYGPFLQTPAPPPDSAASTDGDGGGKGPRKTARRKSAKAAKPEMQNVALPPEAALSDLTLEVHLLLMRPCAQLPSTPRACACGRRVRTAHTTPHAESYFDGGCTPPPSPGTCAGAGHSQLQARGCRLGSGAGCGRDVLPGHGVMYSPVLTVCSGPSPEGRVPCGWCCCLLSGHPARGCRPLALV